MARTAVGVELYKRIKNAAGKAISRIDYNKYASSSQERLKKSFFLGERIDEVSEKTRPLYVAYLKDLVAASGCFDEEFYLKHNKDVKRAGVDPLEHFVVYGGMEGRSPSEAFDVNFYLHKNPQVNKLGLNPFLHYLKGVLNKGANAVIKEYSLSAKKEYVQDFKTNLQAELGNYERVVVMESMTWDGVLQQRPHHIARLLAANKIMVIYIHRDKEFIPRKLHEGLYLVGDTSYIRTVREVEGLSKFYWLFSTQLQKLPELKETLASGYGLIYDYIDDFDESISGNITHQLSIFHALESLKPTILIASATNLRKQLTDRFPEQRVLLCQNAVDMNHFSFESLYKNCKVPKDMKPFLDNGKPIVGYYGAVAPWLDYELINNLTQKRQDLNFVFIGVDYGGGLENLDLRNNVHFLGAKDYDDLPSYSRWFDCAIIPFKEGDIAKSTSPVKLFEYMAMAIPTVCTRDLRECAGYDYVYMSKNENDFANNIDEAVKARKKESVRSRLIKQANDNTWKSRVETVRREMSVLEKKS